MPPVPKHTRRWFQFRLRELFWLALVVALAFVAGKERRERKLLERDVEELTRQRNLWFDEAQLRERKLREKVALVRERDELPMDAVDARILQVRLDACDSFLKEAGSLPAEESYQLCLDAFKIIDPAMLSTLLERPSVAQILVKDSLFDAGDYQALPSAPREGEHVYLLKLPKWTETGFGIYLYFRQESYGYVNLQSDSRDIFVRAVPGL